MEQLGLYDWFSQGTLKFILARERYMDDYLHTALQAGVNQVVILGAGFDTRAYRTAGIDQTQVFEVDHPATQVVKREKLTDILNTIPKYVTFVPVDFNSQTLQQCLLSTSYNPQAKTLFIWQGVTVYLSAKGVDATLAFIAQF